ncbi:MAG: MauE/DoxX family redox-associated membrane protein [Bacillota bacterium]|jgi:uncharacterized membrane protein YphA (DoxX/SURF4 family)|nr:DoxX family membrane protein [Clostridia bacterium]
MILRWLLAGIYLYAGGTKVFNPVLFQATILSYYNIPEALALVVAILFPWLEIMAGLSLLVNWKTKYSAGFLFFLSLFFFIQMILNYSNILPYGCGCFGFSGPEKISLYHIGRDFLIVALAGLVCIREWKRPSAAEK